MMEAERASETLDCSSILTRLVAREDFIAGYCHFIPIFMEKKINSETKNETNMKGRGNNTNREMREGRIENI
jgi:hypothetical protein